MYLLDANVFIQAKNLHYGFDFCPAFWDWLDDAFARQRVFSIDKVETELGARNDDLAQWVSSRQTMFLGLDNTVVPSLQQTAQWVISDPRNYTPAARADFLQKADYFLVAYAHAHNFSVVTHEFPGTGAKKVKIPDACRNLGVTCITPFQMLRAEHASFVLSSQK